MAAYEKVDELINQINNKSTLIKGRNKETNFTRNRKIQFKDLILFTLNKRGMSLKMEMNNFTESIGRMENVSKSALCQQRKKINPIVFKDLNEGYIRNSYDNEKDYNTYKGYVVTAIDGMKIEVPDVEELKKRIWRSKRKNRPKNISKSINIMYI